MSAAAKANVSPTGAPGGAKFPDQTGNFEFEDNVMNDADSFRYAEHHMVRELGPR